MAIRPYIFTTETRFLCFEGQKPGFFAWDKKARSHTEKARSLFNY
ncbi:MULTISPECIES: hypothetical protein [Planktothricoides]|uniref:Uncharacterized protein n=1 Tax=Planktothricoides raciborskii GIHE-MW2 TaxID=2792601 RepID=A0AAU8J8D8_9CYAN|nr:MULTISPECIES: hypothetical protein [Planktothricoides]